MTLLNNLLKAFRKEKIEDMDAEIGVSSILFHKSNCKHKNQIEMTDITPHYTKIIFCTDCKRTLWGMYEGKRLWARQEIPQTKSQDRHQEDKT